MGVVPVILVLVLSGVNILAGIALLVALVKGYRARALAWLGALVITSAGLGFFWALVWLIIGIR